MKKKYICFVLLVAGDCVALFISFYLAFITRKIVLPVIFPTLLSRPPLFSAFLSHSYLVLIWIVVFGYEKLYIKRQTALEDARILIKSNMIAFAMIAVAVFITKGYFQYSRIIIVLAWSFSFGVLPIVRYIVKLLLIRIHLWKKRVLVIGSPEGASSVIEAIARNRTLGYDIVGCLTDDRTHIGESISGVPILGHFDEIEMWKEKTGFEDIIVSFPNIHSERLIGLLKRWDAMSETIRYIPQTGDLMTTGIEIENIGNVLALVLRKNLHKPWNLLVKRILEFGASLVLMILLVPYFLIMGIVIKLDSKGPVFFRQERYGRRGKMINVIKMRTMHLDADARLSAFLQKNPVAREEWETYRKLKVHDPRVTRIGAFLRKYSLDELPQIANVFKGDMSLVGPRPYLREELEEIKHEKSILFQVKPGITGLWQISGRSHLSFEERLNLDEAYIRNWSLWMDLTILVKTTRAAASGHGAF
jgi:undecaprenyl-phosphate galactose phosphotransferase